MRNNFINQNGQQTLHKQSSASKIIVKSNGKISLSKSTQSGRQGDRKNQQINFLKKQIFQLKCQLQQEKTQNKKITILSNEIKKVKQRLIRKVSENNAQQREEILFNNGQRYKNFQEKTDLQQTIKDTGSNHDVSTPKVSMLKDSTDQIFKNFSLIKSASKKSSLPRDHNQSKLITGNSKVIYLDEIESLESRQIAESRLNQKLFKFKNRQQSFLEDKTVKYPAVRQIFQSQQTFFNELQEYELGHNQKVWPESQKLSVTNCINSKRNKNKQKDSS